MEIVLTDCTLGDSLKALAASEKQMTFIRGGEEYHAITYGKFYHEVLKVCAAFQRLGLKEKNELVIIISDNELFLTVFWACLLTKVIAVPVAPGSQDQHKAKVLRILDQLEQPWIIADDFFFRDLDRYVAKQPLAPSKAIKRIETGNILPDNEEAPQLPYISTGDIAYIQYSSGSTGDPKGVVLTHENLLSNTKAIANRLHITATDRALAWLPLTHDMGMICFHLTSIVVGCDQIIIPTTLFIKRPLLWMDWASRSRATLLYSPNFGYQYLMKSIGHPDSTKNWQLDSIRVIVNGAEPISEKITRQFLHLLHDRGLHANAVFPGYGLAEASVAVTLPHVEHQLSFVYCKRQFLQTGKQVVMCTPDDPDCLSFADCGSPVDECAVRITDDNDHVLPPMSVGNIQVKGKNVTAGYYRQPGMASPFTMDGWLRTGDLGFLHNHLLIVTGRKKNIIIVNGQNYYPHDIEQLIEQELDLRPGSVVAVGMISPAAVQQIALFVLFKGSVNDFFECFLKVKELLASQLGIYPDFVLPVRTIPKTTSGKVMHYRITEALLEGSFKNEIDAIAGLDRKRQEQATHKNIPELLAQVLKETGIDSQVSPDTSLFNAGLSSLKALSLINALAKHHYDISFTMLYEADTPARLAELLRNRTGKYTGQDISKSDYTNTYPLSWGQKQIYVAHLLAPGSANLNISFYVDIRGALDEVRFLQAFRVLARQYDVFRTAIVWKENEPMQVLYPPEELAPDLVAEDLTLAMNVEERLKEKAAWMACTPFRLHEAPLYRIYLARIGPERYRLICAIHHIISDGWSIQLIGKEWGRIYQALGTGKEAPWQPEKLQYRDFVFWQQKLRESEKYRQYKLFWEEYLKGGLPGTKIPPCNARHITAENGSAKGATYRKYYSPERTDDISAIARLNGVSFFSVLVSSLAVLISRYNYSDTDNLLVGIDTAGRTHPQLETQIGYFLHALPVLLTIDEKQAFLKVLNDTYKNLLSVYDHQTFCIDEIISSRYSNFSTYNILILFQNFDEQLGFNTISPEIETVTEEIENDTCLNDLLFEFSITTGQLCLRVKYNTALYDEQYISAMCEHLENILRQVCSDPGIPVGQVPLLPAQEQERLLYAFNNTYVDWGIQDMNLVTCFEQQAALQPERIALVCDEKTLTYGELNRRANQVANRLIRRKGMPDGGLIGVSTGRNDHLVIGILGILKAGRAYVPVDPEYPAERIRYIIEDSGMNAMLVDNHSGAYDGWLDTFLLTDTAQPADDDTNPSITIRPSDCAYVIYTSGSTGYPKGVIVPHRAVINYVFAFAAYFNINTMDRVVLQSSIAFDTMVEELFPALLKGAVLVLAKEGGRDIDRLSELIAEKKITVLSATPLVIAELNDRLGNISSLRLIISGGDELQPAHIDKLIGNIPLYNTYGPTEATVCASYFPVTDINRTHFIGKPIANAQVYILDNNLQPQPVNVAGELCIGGEGVALGYLNNPPLTEERFVLNPYGIGKLYRTGDLARWDAQGNIEFLGRRDNQVKVRGYRIELREIEQCLLNSDLVDQVVVNVYSGNGEKSLFAYYTGKEESAVVLRSYLQLRLPYYMVPSFFIRLAQLPLTPNGKIDRKSLPPPQLLSPAYQPPETPVEQAVALIWENVLKRDKVSMNDNFFEIGGQSLKAIQVISKIFKELSVRLELRDLFTNPVLAQLTEKVEILMWINMPVSSDLTNNTDEIII